MDDPDHSEPDTFQSTPPTIVATISDQVVEALAAYGWYFLAVGFVILLNWERIQNYFNQRYREKSEKEYEAKCKKDPDWLLQRQREMEAARKRMQEELDRKAVEHAAKMKEREEQRRSAALANTEGGQRLGHGEATVTVDKSGTNSTKKPYRPEYHPLMGSGGSGGYRPQRRGCPGGGCG